MKLSKMKTNLLGILLLNIFSQNSYCTTTVNVPGQTNTTAATSDTTEPATSTSTAASVSATDSTTITTTTSADTTTMLTSTPTTTISIGDQMWPVNLTFTAITSTSLNISWSHNYISTSNVSYNVTARSIDSNDSNPQQVNCSLGSGTMAQCSNLTPGHMYNVTVMATSGVESRSDTQTQAIDPGMPGDLTSTSHSAPNVSLSWAEAPGQVEYYSLSFVDGKVQNCSINSCLVTGLQPGTQYSVTITAYSNTRPGARRQSSFQTQVVAPDPPKELKVVAVTNNTVSLQWQQPNNTGSSLTGYRVCNSVQVYLDLPSKGPNCTNITILEQTNNYTVSGLTAGAFYTFQVYATNTDFNSSVSANVSAQTKESVPGQVMNFNVSNQGKGQVIATWQRPESPHGNITNYRLTWNNQGDTVQCAVFPISNGQPSNCSAPIESISTIHDKNFSYVVMNLTAATMYSFTIVAFTLQGEGVISTKELNTSVEIPGSVSNVTVIDIKSNRFTVQWMIPDSNPGPTNYIATAEDATGLGWGNLTRTCNATGYTSVNCTIQDLEEYWEYNISVTANTSEGASDTVYADNIKRTEAGVPGAATDLNVTNFSNCDARRVNFTWMTPPVLERNANISQYQLRIFSTDDNAYNNVFHTDKDAQNHVYKASRLLHHEYSVLKAEQNYTWQVQSLPNGHNATSNFTTGTCKPPGWKTDEYQNVIWDSSTINSVTVKLEKRFFMDDSQGRITKKFLVVASTQNGSAEFPDLFWVTASQANFVKPYKIYLKDTDIQETFMIGSGPCDTKNDSCNGPLPAAHRFFVRGGVCTSAGCTYSQWFGPFKSATPTKQSPFPWAAVVIPLVALILLLVLVGALWYKKVIDPSSLCKGSGGDENGNLTDIPKRESAPPCVKKRPILLSDFAKQLELLHKDTNLKFSEQYEDISRIGKLIEQNSTTEHANIEENKPKNRWVNILPFDHSRVKLLQLDDDDPTSDYINANYMPGFKHTREYIASQGPLPGTMDDFWRMVWEQKSHMIVMLTQCKEGNRVKCEQYWPSELQEPKQYGDIVVNLISLSTLDKYNISIFQVTLNHQTRQVMHFHYLDFPDFSANVIFDHFLEFVKTVRNHVPRENPGPIIVHCSAGVGRTGTYMAVDRLYQFLQKPDFTFEDAIVDIFNMVISMRENRVSMVQTESQYVMIHDCLLKLIEAKRIEMLANLSIDSDDNLYANQGFDEQSPGKQPYPEVLYENLNDKDIKLEMAEEEPYENVGVANRHSDEIQTEL